ncbi:MAG TPA: response regulator transcription factor [Chryseosolibacter sp.]
MSKARILVIDDEAQIRRLLQITLQANEFDVASASSGEEAILMVSQSPPDLILLDLGLPDKSGHEVLKHLREWYSRPILIISVQSDEQAIVKALDNGANDYVVKPFRTGELLARVRSALRHSFADTEKTSLSIGDITIDLVGRIVKRKGSVVKLTATEYSLLSLLARNEGKVLTHQFLLTQIWGQHYHEQSQYLRVYIGQLRKKIEDDPNRPKFIVTESGVGYRFTAN